MVRMMLALAARGIASPAASTIRGAPNSDAAQPAMLNRCKRKNV